MSKHNNSWKELKSPGPQIWKPKIPGETMEGMYGGFTTRPSQFGGEMTIHKLLVSPNGDPDEPAITWLLPTHKDLSRKLEAKDPVTGYPVIQKFDLVRVKFTGMERGRSGKSYNGYAVFHQPRERILSLDMATIPPSRDGVEEESANELGRDEMDPDTVEVEALVKSLHD